MAEITLTAQNFEQQVLQSPVPVLVDFWATWCGPCQMLAPIVAQIAEEHADTLRVCKVNVDDVPELAIKFGIMSIPTVLIFQNGQLLQTVVGLRSKAQLEALLP